MDNKEIEKKLAAEAVRNTRVEITFEDLDKGGYMGFSVRQARVLHRELNKLFGDSGRSDE